MDRMRAPNCWTTPSTSHARGCACSFGVEHGPRAPAGTIESCKGCSVTCDCGWSIRRADVAGALNARMSDSPHQQHAHPHHAAPTVAVQAASAAGQNQGTLALVLGLTAAYMLAEVVGGI